MTTSWAAKTVIITGASRGIGSACARTMAAAGAHVVLAARSFDAVDALARELRAAGHEALAVNTDVTSPDDNETLAQAALAAFGSIDVLIANAGIESSATVLKSAPAEWIDTITTNLVGSYLGARAVLPAMKEQGRGQLLFIGSGVGHAKTFGRSAYGSSKAGVSYLSAVLATEVWRYGISVNEIVPGPVATAMTENRWSLGEAPEQLPSERVKSPTEVADLVHTVLALGPNGPTGQVFSLARRPL